MSKLSEYLTWEEEILEDSILSWRLIFDMEKEVASITKNGRKVISECEDIKFTDKSTFSSDNVAVQHMKEMRKFIDKEVHKLKKY